MNHCVVPVSYTHLDVYKRQERASFFQFIVDMDIEFICCVHVVCLVESYAKLIPDLSALEKYLDGSPDQVKK